MGRDGDPSRSPWPTRPERAIEPNGTLERAARKRSTEATRTGIIHHIDDLGRIVIPIELRKRFTLGEKNLLEISVKDDTILLSEPQTVWVFCGRRSSLREHRGRVVCRSCVDELASTS